MALAAATIGVAAAPAYAELGRCHPDVEDSSFSVVCEGSPPNSYRAWVLCANGMSNYGQWEVAGSGDVSYAHCPVNIFVVQWRILAT